MHVGQTRFPPPAMKTNLHCFVVRLALALVTSASIGVAPLGAADDIENLFQMGRAAYYKGDLEQARQLLTMVEAQAPRHQETRILLGEIRAKLRTSAGSSLKMKYQGVKLGKIEFADVTLQEALDGLRALSKNASNGQVVPNFIVTDSKVGENKISLNLTDVPLTTAIDYVARVAGAKAAYDQHAVLFTSAAGG
jgi:hypothetical protein